MPINGISQSAYFTQLLDHGATWSVGAAPALVTVSAFPVGAFYISGICGAGAGGLYFNGVDLDGLIIN